MKRASMTGAARAQIGDEKRYQMSALRTITRNHAPVRRSSDDNLHEKDDLPRDATVSDGIDSNDDSDDEQPVFQVPRQRKSMVSRGRNATGGGGQFSGLGKIKVQVPHRLNLKLHLLLLRGYLKCNRNTSYTARGRYTCTKRQVLGRLTVSWCNLTLQEK